MARQKSVRDIINQRNRIQQELINGVGTTTRDKLHNRYQRATKAADRYVANTERKIGSTLNSKGGWNRKADIPVSRNTYMGLSKG